MTTTSYGIETSPKLAPKLDGRKVVFSREAAEEPKDAESQEQPKQESKSKGSDK